MVSSVTIISNSSIAVDAFVRKLTPGIRPLVEKLRRIILTSSEQIKEEVKYGIPFYIYKGQLCYLNPIDDKVVLGFSRGAEMPDENKLLVGSGKTVRHVVFRCGEPVNEEKIRNLVYEALIVNEMRAGKPYRK